MKKVICIPDSFKGTMSSAEVCAVMKQVLHEHLPEAEILEIPVADGGEGTVDAFLATAAGEKIWLPVRGPYFEEMQAFYGMIGDTAIIEMAACAGLPLVEDRKNPLLTTTYGAGQLMLDAARRGCRKMIVGLGGSATNDAGCGAAAALGVQFLNASLESFIPTGGTLENVRSIDVSNIDPILADIEIVTMCDIDNPMFGLQGAAYIFGPQKGADEAMVQTLDQGLRHLSNVIQTSLGIDVSQVAGGGAAGGMGAGMIAFLGSELKMGIEVVLDTVQFETLLEHTDLVFTGEGRIDTQSLRGKVPIGVARRAKQKQIPVIAVAGAAAYQIERVYEEGVSAYFTINQAPLPFEEAKQYSLQNLAITMENIIRLLQTNKTI